jgi:hypothetical protein
MRASVKTVAGREPECRSTGLEPDAGSEPDEWQLATQNRGESPRVNSWDEYDTSVTCWRCGSKNTSREVQRQLECDDCGLDDNADKNGASNIGKRAVSKDIQSPLSTVGAVVAQPETQVRLEGLSGAIEPANTPDDVGLALSEGTPRR